MNYWLLGIMAMFVAACSNPKQTEIAAISTAKTPQQDSVISVVNNIRIYPTNISEWIPKTITPIEEARNTLLNNSWGRILTGRPQISIGAFFIDESEMSGNEYREFVETNTPKN